MTLKRITNKLVSTSLSLAVFLFTGINAFAYGDVRPDFTVQNGPYVAEEHIIGLGESVTLDIPQASDDLDDVLNAMDGGVAGLDAANKTYTASDNVTYNIESIQNSRRDSELHATPNVPDVSDYYNTLPVLHYDNNDDGTVTITENSGKTDEELHGLIVDQSDILNWYTTLKLSTGTGENTQYKFLDVRTGTTYFIRIRENYRPPVFSNSVDAASGSDVSDSSKDDDDDNDNGKEVIIEMTLEEAQKLQQFYKTNATVSVGSANVKSSIEGNFTATSVAGAAITTPKAEISKALGLAEGEKAAVTTWDVTPKSSPLAYASLVAGANSVGGEIGPAIQVNITKTGPNNKNLSDVFNISGTVEMVVGIPAYFYQPGAKYAVSHVLPGGKYEIFEDNDNDPMTVSFPVSAGYGAYALVRIK